MKTPERWDEIEKLFHAALERDASHRAAFLAEACGPDDELRNEVDRLIKAHEQQGSFIDSPAYEAVADLMVESHTTIPAGRTIAHYRVIDLVGKGGMGEVYVAEDTRLNRKVALKLLPARFTENRNRLARFIQEAQTASALNHPNIITIYEIGESDGAHYIATEYIEGRTLRSLLSKSRLKITEALDIAIQVASALAAAHAAGIVHRDIKPENIMLRPDGYVKVLDFGLAKLTESSTDSRGPVTDSRMETVAKVETEPGMLMGTVNYMSPEQARAVVVDERTDVFSLGIVIYEMVAARMPFRGETSMDVLVAIIEKEPLPISHYAKDAPAELQHIVMKAMRKPCGERYQTIKDLWIDLKNLREEMAFEARRERSQSPEASSDHSATDERTPIPTTESAAASTNERALQTVSIKRKRAAIIALAAVALAAAAIVGAIVWPRPPAPSVPVPATVTPAPERVLNYWGVVQKLDGKQFPLAGGMGFYVEQGDKIRLNFKSPQPGYLYILNEGPATGDQPLPFVVLFPSPTANQGSALLAENEQVQIPERSWFQFDKEEGTERVWLVWSANPVPRLEAVKRFVNAEDKGSVNDTTLDADVREFLKAHSTPRPDFEKNDDRKQTTVTAKSDILVHAINLEHH